MIPLPAIAAWRSRKPWRSDAQVAQDLLLSALAIEIANDPATARALVWRGGTCLHQLHLSNPERYSEDLDYVLLEGAADYRALDLAFARIAVAVDAQVDHTDRSRDRYKAYVSTSVAGRPGGTRVKVEINTADAAPRFELIHPPLEVLVAAWYVGRADILTYCPAELVGTKFRALAQRTKGRDLWDLSLARTKLAIPDDQLAGAAAHYLAHDGVSPGEFRSRLAAHLRQPSFLADLDPLLVGGIGAYDAVETGREVIVWSDAYLDPLLPNHAQRQTGTRPGDGLLVCPVFTPWLGTLTRCKRRIPPGDACPDHPDAGGVRSW